MTMSRNGNFFLGGTSLATSGLAGILRIGNLKFGNFMGTPSPCKQCPQGGACRARGVYLK
jgi:hypothetical protein